MTRDIRLEELSQWIHHEWPNATIEVASADASFRRYFRITNEDKTSIAMDAPPEQEDCTPFIEVTERLLKANVHAPKIIRQNIEQGFLLLEDFGNTPYLDKLNNTSADELYGDAMKALINITKANSVGLPEYDADFLRLEMDFMPEWFLHTHLQINPTQDEQAIINHSLEHITQKVIQQPQVFVHRDFHSRNLMLTKEDNPGVIDYQDAMFGPITYDLVSLLRDCYIQWPNEKVEAWTLDFKTLATKAKLLKDDIDDDTFIEWFDYMGLQRHIKVLGIFARLHHRDDKANYLNYLPLTLHYMMNIAQKYEDTKPLFDLFNNWNIPENIGKVNNAS